MIKRVIIIIIITVIIIIIIIMIIILVVIVVITITTIIRIIMIIIILIRIRVMMVMTTFMCCSGVVQPAHSGMSRPTLCTPPPSRKGCAVREKGCAEVVNGNHTHETWVVFGVVRFLFAGFFLI